MKATMDRSLLLSAAAAAVLCVALVSSWKATTTTLHVQRGGFTTPRSTRTLVGGRGATPAGHTLRGFEPENVQQPSQSLIPSAAAPSAAWPVWCTSLAGSLLGCAAVLAAHRLRAARRCPLDAVDLSVPGYGAALSLAAVTGPKAARPASALRAVADVVAEAAEEAAPAKEAAAAAPPRPHVAVVGAGWAGWAACKALIANGCRVTLLDSLPDPTGATPVLTPTGKPFDAGQRGFWKDYPNIEAMVREVGLSEKDVFTDFTTSQFFSPNGLEATAPVFSASSLPQLPSPLGQVITTVQNFTRLPLQDRATLTGLLYAMLDFNRDEATFEAYDRMTAHELFIRMGMSKRLVDDFIRPTLLVGLFKPPEELSAAVALELLYFYALAHQDSFDVRWLKAKSVSETLISPLATAVAKSGDLVVKGGVRVEQVLLSENGKRVTGLKYANNLLPIPQTLEVDACVLALGARGLKAVMANSPQLSKRAPELAATGGLNGIDVIACRIWLDRYVKTDAPANVLSRFDGLRGAGGTFFMLDQLQPDIKALWGAEEPQGSVVACDFYNSSALASLSDADIVDLLMKELLPGAVPAFAAARVVDSYVRRYPGAVTWFSPGSYKKRPPLVTSIPNLVCAGDVVRMGDREHGAKGLCQERAFVSGLEAANALARSGQLGANRAIHPVIPIREDEPQVLLGRQANKQFMDLLKLLKLDSPWVR
eukprot:EG_transcript_4386